MRSKINQEDSSKVEIAGQKQTQDTAVGGLINERQAGILLGVSRQTMHRLRKDGEISFILVRGRWVRYTMGHLEEWQENNTTKKGKAKKRR